MDRTRGGDVESYDTTLSELSGAVARTWYRLARRGWTPARILDARRWSTTTRHASYVATDISHAVRIYANRHDLPIPKTCERLRVALGAE